MKRTVLFLCATNGVQSPMAEALLRRIDSEHFESMSAGVEPGDLHPLTVKVMKEVGIDIQGAIPSSISSLQGRDVHFVITLCDKARANCPEFPRAERIHWHLEDPLASTGQKQERTFCALRDQLARRLQLFVLVQVRTRQITTSTHVSSPAKQYLSQ